MLLSSSLFASFLICLVDSKTLFLSGPWLRGNCPGVYRDAWVTVGFVGALSSGSFGGAGSGRRWIIGARRVTTRLCVAEVLADLTSAGASFDGAS